MRPLLFCKVVLNPSRGNIFSGFSVFSVKSTENHGKTDNRDTIITKFDGFLRDSLKTGFVPARKKNKKTLDIFRHVL
jgi:hypothetical protein